uniref:TIGR00341 family protein n=1 Tax=Cyanothece sp. (strain PCC 7425 / ATCC 29141) TaxID=395961 RepID=B8HR12_CYAP4
MRNKYRFPLQLRAYLRYWQKGKLNLIPREQVNAELLDESRPDASFLSLIVASCVIATLGLLANSAAVIIGAMIIAPLMLPIRGLAFGALEGDGLLVRRSLIAIGVGTVLALVISCGIGLLVQLPSFGSEILARSKPTLLDLGVAVAAGAISGYAKAEPRISGSLAGTAIAVALMPPICVIGLGLSQANGELSLGATLLYLTNLLGITLACMLTFVLNGYTPLKQAQRALGLTLTLTSVLVIPLTISFGNLLQQSRLETSLKKALLNRTITFQQVQLVGIETNWLSSPPQVRLTVRTLQPVTPKQVRLLEAFVEQQMGRPFQLIFYVSPVQEVTGEKAF